LKANAVASNVQKYTRLRCRIPDIASKSIRHEKDGKNLKDRKQDLHRAERRVDREEAREQHQGRCSGTEKVGKVQSKPEDEEKSEGHERSCRIGLLDCRRPRLPGPIIEAIPACLPLGAGDPKLFHLGNQCGSFQP